MMEFKTNEAADIKPPKMEGYREIKPESGMSAEDAKRFWDVKSYAASDNDSGTENSEKKEKIYYDDNGEKYREGNKLEPNKVFEINGYRYETDDKGRIISVEGWLRMKVHDYVRNMEDVRKMEGQEYESGDDRGHLIAHQFGGSDKLENLVPMDAKLNQGDFAKLENELADAVKDGADVKIKVEPVYAGDSTRPTEFRVSYSIDGDKNVVVFKNRSGE